MKRIAPLRALVPAALAGLLAGACNQSSSDDAGAGGQSGAGGKSTSVASTSRGSGGTAGASGAGSTAMGGTRGTTPMTGGAAGSGGQPGGGTTGGAPSSVGTGTSTNADAGETSDAAVPDAGQDIRGDGASDAKPGERDTSQAKNDSGADANKKINVWLAGDSTVMKCSGACPCGWGSQFQALLDSDATVVNSAVGGRSIQTWLYDPNVQSTMGSDKECVVSPKTFSDRWQKMLDADQGMKPGDYLFIEFGINDGDSTCPRHVGGKLFQTYLGTMAQAAKKLGALPVFLTSTSYIECEGSTAQTNRGFVAETKAAGSANNVPVIDLTALSAAFYTAQKLCPNGDDYTSSSSAVGKFFCEDHTHFEAAGAAQIAKLVAKAIKDQGLGLAAYLR